MYIIICGSSAASVTMSCDKKGGRNSPTSEWYKDLTNDNTKPVFHLPSPISIIFCFPVVPPALNLGDLLVVAGLSVSLLQSLLQWFTGGSDLPSYSCFLGVPAQWPSFAPMNRTYYHWPACRPLLYANPTTRCVADTLLTVALTNRF
ncbi:hypothetical protein PILCRDRAFT_339689 [Piloderma croceum F 1598]|uniref:Uncharacterized protein n=1 Tax=Piloderma croceum (strain F 1598) TaxID=765440 RepID=A0A0C3BH67_PILCF|nr:hypothetical protein PILCRDRAFT_339689 [Piloderma croceum F 1598]